MEKNINRNYESDLMIQMKNLELLNLLESRCEGLENLLCKNVINLINKKINSIERRVSEEAENIHVKNSFQIKQAPAQITEEDKISKLNDNLDIIESSFKSARTNNNLNFSDIISKKIEENYRLLNELESTNRPIFSKSTEINNKIYIEDKLKEMDDKLNVIFTEYKVKNAQARKNEDLNSARTEYSGKSNKIYAQSLPFERNIAWFTETPAPLKDKKENENEKKKKELLDKLNTTEKKIKEIAGRILKNF
jgi:hypothetical protein